MRTLIHAVIATARNAPRANIEGQSFGLIASFVGCSRCGAALAETSKQIRNFCPECGATFLNDAQMKGRRVLRSSKSLRAFWSRYSRDRQPI